MKKSRKVVATIISVVIWIIINAAIQAAREQSGYKTPGVGSILALLVLIAILLTIWEATPTIKNETRTDIEGKITKLKDLESLRDNNVVSNEEFEKLKQQVLT